MVFARLLVTVPFQDCGCVKNDLNKYTLSFYECSPVNVHRLRVELPLPSCIHFMCSKCRKTATELLHFNPKQ